MRRSTSWRRNSTASKWPTSSLQRDPESGGHGLAGGRQQACDVVARGCRQGQQGRAHVAAAQSGALDLAAFESNLEAWAREDLEGYVVLGSNGEAASLEE